MTITTFVKGFSDQYLLAADHEAIRKELLESAHDLGPSVKFPYLFAKSRRSVLIKLDPDYRQQCLRIKISHFGVIPIKIEELAEKYGLIKQGQPNIKLDNIEPEQHLVEIISYIKDYPLGITSMEKGGRLGDYKELGKELEQKFLFMSAGGGLREYVSQDAARPVLVKLREMCHSTGNFVRLEVRLKREEKEFILWMDGLARNYHLNRQNTVTENLDDRF